MTSTTDVDLEQFATEWTQWHRRHERRRNDPLGFHAITGLYWLTDDPIALADAPGRWSIGHDGAVVELAEGETLTHDDTVIRGRHEFGELAERAGILLHFTDGPVAGAIELARRGGFTIVRPRRSDHPFLASYPGTPAYEPHPRWRVDATFVAFDEPRPTEVGAAVEGLTHVYDAPGVLRFDLDGGPRELLAFSAGAEHLLVLFRDETSGVTTYAANRSILVPAPDPDGRTTIDFTRATNLPCAYTDHATCPLPPSQNHLPVAIEAGEQTPLDRVRAD